MHALEMRIQTCVGWYKFFRVLLASLAALLSLCVHVVVLLLQASSLVGDLGQCPAVL